MKLLLSILLILMVGCRSVPHDTSPAPINHNKMTLELQACGKQEVGLNGCLYKDNLEDTLKVPLWYSGEYQIKSERCNYLLNQRYEGSQTAEFSYQDLLAGKPDKEKTCLYNVKVFIDGFDNGFEGFFLLSEGNYKAAEFEFQSRNYLGYGGLQIKEGAIVNDRLSFTANEPGTIIWEGCQLKGERSYDRNPEINFQEIIGGSPIPRASCVLTVGLIPRDEQSPVELGKVHISIYEKTVQTLPLPVLEYDADDEKLTVRADSLTAVIAIDKSYSIKKGSGKKKFSAYAPYDQEVDVRIATSNGRFILLKVKNGEVLWVK